MAMQAGGKAGTRGGERKTVLVHALWKEFLEEVVFEVTPKRRVQLSSVYLGASLKSGSLKFARLGQKLAGTN